MWVCLIQNTANVLAPVRNGRNGCFGGLCDSRLLTVLSLVLPLGFSLLSFFLLFFLLFLFFSSHSSLFLLFSSLSLYFSLVLFSLVFLPSFPILIPVHSYPWFLTFPCPLFTHPSPSSFFPFFVSPPFSFIFLPLSLTLSSSLTLTSDCA